MKLNEKQKHMAMMQASPAYAKHPETFYLEMRALEAVPTEVAPRTTPAPPPSMNYLEREAWKLGWYNAIYEKDPRGAWPPFPTGNEPQNGEQR